MGTSYSNAIVGYTEFPFFINFFSTDLYFGRYIFSVKFNGISNYVLKQLSHLCFVHFKFRHLRNFNICSRFPDYIIKISYNFVYQRFQIYSNKLFLVVKPRKIKK